MSQRVSVSPGVYQRVPLDGFVQINPEINRALVARVLERAQERGVGRALDLYCGSGNFVLPWAAANIDATGVELVPSSIRAARQAAAEQGLRVDFYEGKVADYLESERVLAHPDLLLVDPPRAGLGNSIDDIVALEAKHIFVVSCSPPALARDLRALCGGGYRLTGVEVFDMFMHTEHSEVLAWLIRG